MSILVPFTAYMVLLFCFLLEDGTASSFNLSEMALCESLQIGMVASTLQHLHGCSKT